MSADPDFDRLLRRLEDARGEALARADAALRGDAPTGPQVPPRDAAPPPTDAPADTPVRPEAPAAPPPWRTIELPPTAPSSLPTVPARRDRPVSPALRALRGIARPVAALVLTATAVLGGWLLVLEPALGSRPVLVRDEAMSPSLRTGDVALAVAPEGPLGAGTIVAVRLDGRTAVTRVIGREEVPVEAGTAARAAAGLVVRADGEPLEVSTVVPLDDVVGEVGAAVPRVGLPVVLLRDPGTAPVGTLVVVALLGLSGLGVVELARERRGPSE